VTILYNNDLDQNALSGRRVCVLGFGAQGRAQALNLRDSGIDVVLGLRGKSPHRADAIAEGLDVHDPAVAVSAADVVAMLVPDTEQPEIYRQIVAPNLRAGGCLLFAHGYAVHFGKLEPRQDLDVVMVAPLGIGEQVRLTFEKGAGVPALVAVAQDASGQAWPLALAYARADGHGRAGVLETSFAEETETDLFAEQAVLVGGVSELVGAAFDTLVEAGYAPEVAYFCCLHELKLMADMLHRHGIAGMRDSISATADYGGATRGPRIIGDAAREAMRAALDDIRSGRFDSELQAEAAKGFPRLAHEHGRRREALIEKVGAELRAMMPWLGGDRKPGGKA
jgi:ketol-acid reductoisomerase